MGRYAGTEWMTIQNLRWGTTSNIRRVAQLQETTVKLLAVYVAGRCRLEDEVLHRFNGSFSVAIRLRVVWRGRCMVDTPPLQKILEVAAGELRSSICSKAEGNTNLSEVAAENSYGVGSSSITFTWDNHRPPRESISNDKE